MMGLVASSVRIWKTGRPAIEKGVSKHGCQEATVRETTVCAEA